MAKDSMIASMQPTFCCDDNGSNLRSARSHHHRPLAEHGKSRSHAGVRQRLAMHLAAQPAGRDPGGRHPTDLAAAEGGNDFPGGTFDGAGQGGAVATKDSYVPEERLSVEQAVNAYTQGSAYARFSEDRIGTLEAGKEADLAVLSQDIFSVKPEEIGKAKVVITMVGGKVVFTEGK